MNLVKIHTRTMLLVPLWAALAAVQTSAELAKDPSVRAALEAARRNEPAAIEQEIAVCEIPAPPFHEDVRARELQRLFTGLGLRDVRIDKAGNVIGVRPG